MNHGIGYYHVFPFQEVKKGERIIIWGMGEVGRQYVQQIKKTGYCTVSFCVDKNWNTISKYQNIDIYAPDKVRGRSERILIANGNADVADKIKSELSNYGITKEKILYHDLICENTVSFKNEREIKKVGEDFLGGDYFKRKKDEIDVGFYIHGGLGDILININYILAFKDRFKNDDINVDLYVESNKKYTAEFFTENFSSFRKISFDENEMKKSEREADLFIHILRYPWLKRVNLEKLKNTSPALAKYSLLLKRYEIEHSRYFGNGPCFDGMSCMESEAKEIRRIFQPDVYGYLSINEKCKLKFPNFDSALKQLNLPQKYITINRDVDSAGKKNNFVSTWKLWPTEYYNKLIELVKKEYPDIPIIAIGANRDPDLAGFDIDLLGKTTAVEIEAVLKYSSLHISSEGGTVHLRHMLNGGMSIVLFGPTSPIFYGYSENINLRSNTCEYPCEWITGKWVKNCVNKIKKHQCMLELTPEFVMNEIKRKWVL